MNLGSEEIGTLGVVLPTALMRITPPPPPPPRVVWMNIKRLGKVSPPAQGPRASQ